MGEFEKFPTIDFRSFVPIENVDFNVDTVSIDESAKKILSNISSEQEFTFELKSAPSLEQFLNNPAAMSGTPYSTMYDGKGKYMPKKVWKSHQGRTMTVEFNDGEKVTVNTGADKEPDEFVSFCIAIAKHLIGSTTKIERAFEMAQNTANAKKLKRKAENDRKKLAKKKAAETEKEIEEFNIRRKMNELYIEQEAKRRIAEEEKKASTEGNDHE